MKTVKDATVLTEVRDGVACLTFNRADKANALDAETGAAFKEAVDRISTDKTLRVLLLKSAGKIFCAGGDIGTFTKSMDALPSMLDALLDTLNAAMLKLAALPVPIISVLQGPVGGGGIGIALCADYILAAESMKLRGGYSAIGLTPDAAGTWHLTRRAGPALAKQLFILNEPMSAGECLTRGIVDAVYPDEQLATEADELAQRLLNLPHDAIARIKSLVDGCHACTMAQQLEREREYMVASAASADAREGISAFLEKRPPTFLRPA